MSAQFKNVYNDKTRADAYARLEFPGTYYLAFRDLPAIIREHVHGRNALDFGCGAGRSTRFLRNLGFHVVGIDISEHMLARARELDPDGEYRLVAEEELIGLVPGKYDLILSAFTFDNIPTMEKKSAVCRSLEQLLNPDGSIINVVSSPEIYIHEWTSFSTKDFPENRIAKSGDRVRIVMLDVDDRRPVEDVVCSEEDYVRIYTRAGLKPVSVHRPLGNESEDYFWVNETRIAPWTIYTLKKNNAG